jgi:hypothetical protein
MSSRSRLVECAHYVAREIIAPFKPRFGDADFDVANAHYAARCLSIGSS